MWPKKKMIKLIVCFFSNEKKTSETADKIISGSGKFEALMAASQEIAASCAQLVVASRVKADSSSQNLSNLSKSSKSVLQETGNIIAITKHCSKLIEDNGKYI